MTPPAPGRLSRRLRRILLLLPYAIRNQGVTLDELSDRFGIGKQDLLEDLELLFLCGLPGYGPGDLIDVSIDHERVFVSMADYFARPLRLTPAEALSLYSGAAALAGLPGMEQADALSRALDKLESALGASDGDGTGVSVRVESGPGGHLQSLGAAVRNRKRVRINYFSASRGRLSERSVDPWGLIAALGRWYLIGWDHASSDERMFRIDRIKSAEVTDEDAPVPDDFNLERYRGAFVGREGQERVTIEISSRVAAWFEEYYPTVSATDLPDGWKRVELVSGGRRWAATLVLRLGEDVRNVLPPDVRQTARSLAEEVVAAHQTP